ncbi:MAG: DUF63 family protein [Candidatus Micrarchaeota archaeon]|nr:DUF63 family protein [Candidatus Micrarchaeota archaeon]
MDVSSFVSDYFISPIWDKTGYNIVNTLVYASLALVALYALWRIFKKYDIQLDAPFWAAVAAWSAWGSSIRVLTDSVDSGQMAKALALAGGSAASAAASAAARGLPPGLPGGAFDFVARSAYPAILQSHVLDYGFATVTPGIYIVTAALFLAAFAVSRKLGLPYWAAGAGALGALLNLALLLPLMNNWAYAAVPVGLALAAGLLLYYGLKWRKYEMLLPVMAQALDGASTWVAIDWFGPARGIPYFEQHVLSSAIGHITPLGFGLFFLLKVAFATLAVHLLYGEKMDTRTRNLALLVIVVIGLAPGTRDLLRMLCGT